MMVIGLSSEDKPWISALMQACVLATPSLTFRWITDIEEICTSVDDGAVIVTEAPVALSKDQFRPCAIDELSPIVTVLQRYGLQAHCLTGPRTGGPRNADLFAWDDDKSAYERSNSSETNWELRASTGISRQINAREADEEPRPIGTLIAIIGGDSSSSLSAGHALASLAGAHERVMLIDGTLTGEAALLYGRRGDAPGIGELVREYARNHDLDLSIPRIVDQDNGFDLLLGITHPQQSVLVGPRFANELLEWSLCRYDRVFVICDPTSAHSPFLDIIEVEDRLSISRIALRHASAVVTVVDAHELGVVRFANQLESCSGITREGAEHLLLVLRTHTSSRSIRAIRSEIVEIATRGQTTTTLLLDASCHGFSVELNEGDTFLQWLTSLPATDRGIVDEPPRLPVGDELATLYHYFESLPD